MTCDSRACHLRSTWVSSVNLSPSKVGFNNQNREGGLYPGCAWQLVDFLKVVLHNPTWKRLRSNVGSAKFAFGKCTARPPSLCIRFQYSQIDAVIQKLRENGSRVLLVLHPKWLRADADRTVTKRKKRKLETWHDGMMDSSKRGGLTDLNGLAGSTKDGWHLRIRSTSSQASVLQMSRQRTMRTHAWPACPWMWK